MKMEKKPWEVTQTHWASASPFVEFSLSYKSYSCSVGQVNSQNEKYLKADKRYSHIFVYKMGGSITYTGPHLAHFQPPTEH